VPRKKPAETAVKKTAPKRKPAAGKAPEGQPGQKLRVKQVRSEIGHAETYRRTLRSLGLRHYQHEIVVTDTPTARGMLRKVWHLVRVQPAEA
jgi:large subunit ribosomal protein L30